MSNLELMRMRLQSQGGINQEDRMIKDKYRTFLRALKYSYQGADVQLVQPFDTCFYDKPYQGEAIDDSQPYRALINPDKVKQDYDDKILSIDYMHGFNPGDVFKWIGTESYWLIYLQELTEDAYFRGEIRRCKYKIKFKDKDGAVKYTWAAIRGPVETKIDSVQKNQIRVDRPNLTLNILLPQNSDTLFAFDRYKKFLFAGKCWQVQAPDSISIKNVIEINAEEYYIDKDADDIDQEIKDGLIIEAIDPNVKTNGPKIIGETFIKPKLKEIYTAPSVGGTWAIKEKCVPVCVESISDTEVAITWQKSTSGQFTLLWADNTMILEKIIVIESLF